MHLVEILLPLTDNSGKPFAPEMYADLRELLTTRFGGVTAFMRAPAHGTTTESGKAVHDDIVAFEVMTETLDVKWWREFRRRLEADFRQDTVVIRASQITLL